MRLPCPRAVRRFRFARPPRAPHPAMDFDVCNGDADGLFALIQLRLAQPAAARLVTGLKHEIELLAGIEAGAGDRITVLDLSLRRNRPHVDRLLAAGARIAYFDHHAVDEVPRHPNFTAHIDAAPDVCTSMLVDRHLGGRFRPWAVAAAYGDNLPACAARMADGLGLSDRARATLRRLGEAVNYNAYGDSESDVVIPPRALYPLLARHADPLRASQEPVVRAIARRRRADLRRAAALAPAAKGPGATIVQLPDAPWSRRVLGTFANLLAQQAPERAHAVIARHADGRCTVSVRAPLRSPHGADALCRRFGGGGRSAAAAIDRLPDTELPRVVEAVLDARWVRSDPAPATAGAGRAPAAR
jgi:hypothetical protein